jgi:hypothetical protein
MAKSSIVLDEPQHNFLPVIHDAKKIERMMKTNLGGEQLGPGDLDRAVNPSGKNTKWEIPDIDETSESISELIGVIIYACDKRRWYKGKYTGGNERPDCYSDDGIHGIGAHAEKCEDGLCVNCPMDIFGSGPNKGKACKQVKRVYLLREGEMLPVIINLTPQNRRALRTYGARLMNKKNKELTEVVSKFSNGSAVSKSGFPYAKVTISLVTSLAPEAATKMLQYAEMMEPVLTAVTIADDVRTHIEEDDGPIDSSENESTPAPEASSTETVRGDLKPVAPTPQDSEVIDEEDLEF